MTTVADPGPGLDDQIAAWRRYLGAHRAISADDADELEAHLRDQITELARAGLKPDEAFLIAVRRLGAVDQLSWEFAREHSDRLWKQLVVAEQPAGDRRLPVALGLAIAAGLAVKLPALFAAPEAQGDLYLRNVGLLVLPFLAAYFCWRRSVRPAVVAVLAGAAVVAAVLVNTYPFDDDSATLALTAFHLPIALWLLVGVAYTGGRIGSAAARTISGSSAMTCCARTASPCSRSASACARVASACARPSAPPASPWPQPSSPSARRCRRPACRPAGDPQPSFRTTTTGATSSPGFAAPTP